MKIAIIGSRKYKSQDEVESVVSEKLLSIPKSTVPIPNLPFAQRTSIISGGAVGVDTAVKEWAKKYGFMFIEVLPVFNKEVKPYDKIYHDRNDKIVEMADKVIAIWNGNKMRSGTYSVITKCLKRRKNLEVIFVD